MKKLMYDGSYEIGICVFAHKIRSFWVVVWIDGAQWYTADPSGGLSFFASEAKAVEWAGMYGYHYKTLCKAAESQ